jgi:predicted ABC-type transport system involved in lysophospholipase L1 biosynthesis ATPase subunit
MTVRWLHARNPSARQLVTHDRRMLEAVRTTRRLLVAAGRVEELAAP